MLPLSSSDPKAWTDTKQQKAVLRSSSTARKVRARFPAGQRVTSLIHDEPSGILGTVVRHVPGPDAQGGTVTVLWDSGVTGRHTPINLAPIER